MLVRTRFAPSPTGYLHVGGARTALYCWLFAKRHHGKFILRIEDTDRERSTDEFVRGIIEAMEWLDLTYDEGPYFQTQRMQRYHEVAQQLLDEGKAYRCYCSIPRLDALREDQLKQHQKPRYDGLCRAREPSSADQPFVIRFKNPQTGEVVVDDQVYGKVTFQNHELDDLIIIRTDGNPTYNFTVVVDDLDMHVTHVIRGDDHLNNTPRQINILQALGADIPIYAHVPMILGEDGKRLSKRHGAVSINEYRAQGYLPEALLNYLVRLGWSHGDQEIFSLAEMVKLFDIADINKAPAAFNLQKLTWLNQHYIKIGDAHKLAQHLRWHLQQLTIDPESGPELSEVVNAQRDRAKTMKEMAENSRYFFEDVTGYNKELATKFLTSEILPVLEETKTHLQSLDESSWTAAAIHEVIQNVTAAHQMKLGQLAQPLRVALTGGTVSPPIDVTLHLLGKTKTLARLSKAIGFIKQG